MRQAHPTQEVGVGQEVDVGDSDSNAKQAPGWRQRAGQYVRDRIIVGDDTLDAARRRLETRLGAQLLYRTTRHVTLTETGQLYLQHCRQLLDSLADLSPALDQIGEQPLTS